MKKKEFKKKLHKKHTKKLAEGGETTEAEEKPKGFVESSDTKDDDEVGVNVVKFMKDDEQVSETKFEKPTDFTDKEFKDAIPKGGDYDSAIVVLSDDDVQALDKEDVKDLTEGETTIEEIAEEKDELLEDATNEEKEKEEKKHKYIWGLVGLGLGILLGINLKK